jgi:hypothetical protein
MICSAKPSTSFSTVSSCASDGICLRKVRVSGSKLRRFRSTPFGSLSYPVSWSENWDAIHISRTRFPHRLCLNRLLSSFARQVNVLCVRRLPLQVTCCSRSEIQTVTLSNRDAHSPLSKLSTILFIQSYISNFQTTSFRCCTSFQRDSSSKFTYSSTYGGFFMWHNQVTCHIFFFSF